MVKNLGGLGAVADAKVFTAEIQGGVGESVALGRWDVVGGYGGVGGPGSASPDRLVADKDLRVERVGVVLGDFWVAVVIVVVGVGDVGAVDVVEFDFEAVTDVAGVVDRVEVVDAAVGDAGLSDSGAKEEEGGQQSQGGGRAGREDVSGWVRDTGL